PERVPHLAFCTWKGDPFGVGYAPASGFIVETVPIDELGPVIGHGSERLLAREFAAREQVPTHSEGGAMTIRDRPSKSQIRGITRRELEMSHQHRTMLRGTASKTSLALGRRITNVVVGVAVMATAI